MDGSTPQEQLRARRMGELELKFCVPATALATLRRALLARGATRVRLQAHYFDTADGLLARQMIALRLRREGRRWMQALKTIGNGVVHRLEHEVRVGGSGRKVPQLDWHCHDGSEAGKLLRAALTAAPGAALVERCATDIERLHCLVHGARGSLIEVALDLGRASAGARSVPIGELELEHKGGPVQGLFRLGASWQLRGGLWLCSISKAERAARLLAHYAAPVVRKARKAQIDGATGGAALLRALLHTALEQVIVNSSEVAEGVTGTETIHQLRIGLRRLRTVVRELAALSPAIAPEWECELARVFATLGQARDQDVVVAAVRPLLQAAGAPLLEWHAPPPPNLADAVRGKGFQATLLATLALAHAGPENFWPLAPSATRKLVAARLDELHGQVTRDGRGFDKLARPKQHRVRKRLKRLRYLTGMTAPLWPRAAARSYLRRLTAAQDALGRHNDIAVAANAFRNDATAHPDAWFAARLLQATLATTARRARKALIKLAAAPRCCT